MINFPPHECGLYLEHNTNRDFYQTVKQWLDDQQDGAAMYTWENDAALERAIDTNEIWTLQWYPKYPNSFYAVAAPTLEELGKVVDQFMAAEVRK